jgi:hypothetical protein
MHTRGQPGVQGSPTQGAPLIHRKHHFLHDPPSYKDIPSRNRIKKQHMCQHHRQHDRARRQRAEAAPRAEGLTNAPQGESTTETTSTHPHNNPRLVRAAGDVPLPAFRQHTDAQAARGCGRADRRRVSGGTQGRRGGESAPRPHHRAVYTQVFACSAARSVCAMYLAAGAGVGLWRRQQRLRRRRSGCGRHT